MATGRRRADFGQRSDLTFKDNAAAGRHGWLRLTPAYSRRIVETLLDAHVAPRVLDPFSGSSTTPLAAAMRGRDATGVELNPFLVWFGSVKLRRLGRQVVTRCELALERVMGRFGEDPVLPPPIHKIERWWTPPVLAWLCALKGAIDAESALSRDLLTIAFCRTMMALSSASFGHVSMSFGDARTPDDLEGAATAQFRVDVAHVLAGASASPKRPGRVHRGDARTLLPIQGEQFDVVVTSPPYPNRMSYIRELRPYMYWTGHLQAAKQAGELDWKAIGGTWGVATSRLAKWTRSTGARPTSLESLLPKIAVAHPKNGPLLAAYVDRYFEDAATHLAALRPLIAQGGSIHYVVGNSSFYGELVPAEALWAELMEAAGFKSPEVTILRKRNSNKKLYEFQVSADA